MPPAAVRARATHILEDEIGLRDGKIEASRVKSASCDGIEIAHAPARGGVQKYGERYADIQTFDEAAHRNTHAMRACDIDTIANAVAFVAEHDRQRAFGREIFRRELTFGMGRNENAVRVTAARTLQRGCRIGVHDDIDPLVRATRNRGGGEKRSSRTLENVKRLNAECVARSQRGRAIVRVIRRVKENRDTRKSFANHVEKPRPTPLEDKRLEHPNQVLWIHCIGAREALGDQFFNF
jgi:hypothetical protein